MEANGRKLRNEQIDIGTMGAFISNKQSMGEGDMTQAKPTADVYLLCTGMHLTSYSTYKDKAPQNTLIQNPRKETGS